MSDPLTAGLGLGYGSGSAPASVGWPPVARPGPLGVQRSLSPSSMPVASAPVDRRPAEPTFPAATVIQREPDPAPAASAPATVDSPTTVESSAAPPPASTAPEPEELLKTLYDPLLRRLKSELRLDRERLGVITDL